MKNLLHRPNWFTITTIINARKKKRLARKLNVLSLERVGKWRELCSLHKIQLTRSFFQSLFLELPLCFHLNFRFCVVFFLSFVRLLATLPNSIRLTNSSGRKIGLDNIPRKNYFPTKSNANAPFIFFSPWDLQGFVTQFRFVLFEENRKYGWFREKKTL